MNKNIDVLSKNEHHKVLKQWNNTQRDYGSVSKLHCLIEQQAALSPNAVALEFDGQTMIYQTLNQRANQLARLLRLKGAGPDVLVGIFTERSFEMVVSLLAVLKSGGAYVPLDPSYPKKHLANILEDTQAKLVLTQPHLINKLPLTINQVIELDASWETFHDQEKVNLEDLGTDNNLAYVLFTSGSTGRPKGAMIEHRNICNRLQWSQENYELDAEDRILQKTPFSFDVSIWEFFWPLIMGARVIIAKPNGHKDTAYLVNIIQNCNVTTLHFVPSMLRVFLEEKNLKHCTSLKRVLCSGEALPYKLQELFFACLPNVELHNLYGPTEAAVDVTSWVCVKDDERHIVPIGHPVANTKIYVLNSKMQPVPIGVSGELYIGGVQVGRGYINQDDLTKECFVSAPFLDDENARLYKSGDRVRQLEDGAIEFLGRLDDQVKIHGQRIELGEIDAVLGSYPEMLQCVVITRENMMGSQHLVAYVVVDDTAVTIDDLKAYVMHKLPSYMVPMNYIFLDKLPLTSNGKIDRKALPEPEYLISHSKDFRGPRNDIEGALIAIWEEILGVKGIGIDDKFFELGGNSLIAMKLVYKIENLLDFKIELIQLLELPTIASISICLESQGNSKLSTIVPLQNEGGGTPLYCLFGIEIYREFANSLDLTYPVLGVYISEEGTIAEQGNKGEKIHLSVEQLANSYLKAILKTNPKGPYRFAGISFGGIIAIELASKLRKLGKNVELVILFDSVLPGSIKKNWLHWLRKRLSSILSKDVLNQISSIINKILNKVWTNYLKIWLSRRINDVFLGQKLRESAYKKAMQEWEFEQLKSDFDVILFRGLDRSGWGSHTSISDDYGWRKLLQGELHIEGVEGDHLSLIKAPNVQRLGQIAMKYLSITNK